MMATQYALDSIPADLLHEILSRLPIKTVARCRCVSKILASRLGSDDFKKLFLTRSLTRPRLLFLVQTNEKVWVFYSLPHPQNPYEKSLLEVKVDFHSEFPRLQGQSFSYASGLFYFPGEKYNNTSGVIYNPITQQYAMLPKLRTDKEVEPKSFLGFDPIDNQFKVLVINTPANEVNNERIHFILTLGTGKMKWRTIKCPSLQDYPYIWSNGICINGVLYYLSQSDVSFAIVCFDVRTETFKFKPLIIDLPHMCTLQLINYKGKLGITILSGRASHVVFDMLLVQDEEEKQEWSKYILPMTIKFGFGMYVVGMTSPDEIVLSTVGIMFYVHYFNPERNHLQMVKVQGLEKHQSVEQLQGYHIELEHMLIDGEVHLFTDYVEDLYLNDVKHFKSNIHANHFDSINTFEALCLSDEEDDDQVS